MPVLTPVQREQYEREGFLLASGLIPQELARAAEAAMWREMGADPQDPATWNKGPSAHHTFDAPELVALYTPEFLSAAADLAGDDPATIEAPNRAYVINILPQEEEWRWPHPHIDHAIKDAGYKTFPRAFRVATMTFLHDIEPHGGGTIVWPGSHKKLEALALSDPEKYELMWSLNQELKTADVGEPLEITPRQGDVLFYQYLCAHSGSMNTSDRPRFALNCKW